jgi:predicted MFS family arabinose efflux permease
MIAHASALEPAKTRESALHLSTPQMLALVIVACMGFSSQMLMPIWVGQVVDGYGLAPASAGKIASLEMFLVAGTSVVVSFLLGRVPRIGMTAAGLALLIVGNTLCVAFHSYTGLLLCRSMTGIGKGLLVAALFSLAGQTAHPTRSFSIINCGYAAVSTVAFLVAPYFVRWLGPPGIFYLTTGLSLIGACFVPLLPAQGIEASHTGGMFRDARGARLTGILILATFFLFSSTKDCLWVFVERLGGRTGLTLPEIGKILSATSLVAIAGPALAHVTETRFGVTRPMLIAIVVIAALGLAIATTGDSIVFIVSVPVFAALGLFITSYFQGLLGMADPSGGLAAMSLAVSTGGAAFGALVGSWVIAGVGYDGLGPVDMALFVAVFVMLLFMTPGWRRDRSSR